MTFNPNPKKKRIKLSQKEYHELRLKKYMQVHCLCEDCSCWTSLETGHFDHIKTRGSGGDDIIENGKWLCYRCHDKRHRGIK